MLTDNPSYKRIYTIIESGLSKSRNFHAYLFTGGSASAREEIGIRLCRRILCNDELSAKIFDHGNCPDFLVLQKNDDKSVIVREQVLELISKLSFKPCGDTYAILIKDAHLMNEAAQNKLLKTLEEPVAPAVFVLLSERADALLPTIRSRCSSFCLGDEEDIFDETCRKAAETFAGLVRKGTYYYLKKNCISYIFRDKENSGALALAFLECLTVTLEKYMLAGEKKAAIAIERAEKAKMYLKQGHNPAYTIKQFCLAV